MGKLLHVQISSKHCEKKTYLDSLSLSGTDPHHLVPRTNDAQALAHEAGIPSFKRRAKGRGGDANASVQVNLIAEGCTKKPCNLAGAMFGCTCIGMELHARPLFASHHADASTSPPSCSRSDKRTSPTSLSLLPISTPPDIQRRTSINEEMGRGVHTCMPSLVVNWLVS